MYDDIARAAKNLVNTPWHHQGRTPGVGCDCVGVGVLAATATGRTVEDFTCYGLDPDEATLLTYMEANCVLCPEYTTPDDTPVGYGMLFWLVEGKAQHFAIRVDGGMVHARRRRNGVGRVQFQHIDTYYRKHFLSAWRYK